MCRARLKRDGTCAETRFGLSEKWTSPFKSVGESVQSNTGSRGVRISGQTVDRPRSEVECKNCGYPFHSPVSPSLPLPCVTMCHHVSNGLCHCTDCYTIQVVTIHVKCHCILPNTHLAAKHGFTFQILWIIVKDPFWHSSSRLSLHMPCVQYSGNYCC